MYGFPILTSVSCVWVRWADLGWAKISSSPTRSCCGWSERRRLCHKGGGRGCPGQHSVERSTNGCVDEFSYWRAGLGSSKLSSQVEGVFSPMLCTCHTNKGKSSSYFYLHHCKCLWIPLCCGWPGSKNICGAGLRWAALYHALMTTATLMQMPPLSDTSCSFWLILLSIQFTALGGLRHEQDLHIYVLAWRWTSPRCLLWLYKM